LSPATRYAKAGCISALFWPVAQIGCWASPEEKTWAENRGETTRANPVQEDVL